MHEFFSSVARADKKGFYDSGALMLDHVTCDSIATLLAALKEEEFDLPEDIGIGGKDEDLGMGLGNR